jgi:hypothetical protein
VFKQRLTRVAMAVAIAAFASACDDDPTSPDEEQHTIAEYVASVSIDSTPGELRTNAIPRPSGGGPAVSVGGHGTIVNGGTTTVNVTSQTPFQTVYVAGSFPISQLFVPAVSGYFEIPLPAPATSTELLITFPQALASNEFTLHFSAADPEGRVGMPSDRSYNAILVGSGDVQVTVAWDTGADVDLHVVDPEGWEIYWGNRQSPSGGELDLDSNAACVGDNVRNENISWRVGTAPQGPYTVRVDYWSSCDAPGTNYTVVIHNEGQTYIHYGTFSGPGDQGGAGSGVEIRTFTRTTGPPVPPSRTNGNQPVGPTSKSVSR